MEIKNRSIVIAAAILTAFLFIKANCTKLPFDCAKTVYSFQLPVKAFPDKDTINIGDTIWLEINERTLIRDGVSGEMTDYSGAENLGTVIALGRYNDSMKSWVNENPQNFKFVILNSHGKLVNQTDIGTEFTFSEQENSFLFSLAVIPLKKGLFSLLLVDARNVFRASDKCTKASFSIIFENTNQHYPLNPFYIPGTNPRGGDYYFYVK
jgi:hypothetical protein